MWQKYSQSMYRKAVERCVKWCHWDLLWALNFNEEILDPSNQFDLVALHYVFLPLINDKFDAWRQAWSKRRMWTIKTSPIRLWVSGQMNSWWWSGPWAIIVLWCWKGSWWRWPWNGRQRRSNFLFIYLRSPYRRRPFCIAKRSAFPFTSGNYRIGSFIKAKTIVKVNYTE